MEASVSFHHKSFTHINIHSKQQQVKVKVPLINVFFMLVPVLNAPEELTLSVCKVLFECLYDKKTASFEHKANSLPQSTGPIGSL